MPVPLRYLVGHLVVEADSRMLLTFDRLWRVEIMRRLLNPRRGFGHTDHLGHVLEDQFALDVRVRLLQSFQIVTLTTTQADQECRVITLLRSLNETLLDCIVTLVELLGPANGLSLHHVAEPSTYLGYFDELLEQSLTLAIVRTLKQTIGWIGRVLLAMLFEGLGCFGVDGEKVILSDDSRAAQILDIQTSSGKNLAVIDDFSISLGVLKTTIHHPAGPGLVTFSLLT
jgi:hypothetical protein